MQVGNTNINIKYNARVWRSVQVKCHVVCGLIVDRIVGSAEVISLTGLFVRLEIMDGILCCCLLVIVKTLYDLMTRKLKAST